LLNKDANFHTNEAMNLRSFYGRLIRKIWILPLLAFIGMTLGLIIYFLATVVFGPAREYEASSKLYLNFAYDENGDVYDYYNGYTWNELMSIDEILNKTMDYLKEDGVTELAEGSVTVGSSTAVTSTEVADSTTASIPSDIRLLEITITSHDKELAAKILKATDKSLVDFGESRDEFTSIEILEEDDEATLVTYTNRTLVAMIFGGLLVLVIGIFVMYIREILDDSLYVAEDSEKRYKIPTIGIVPSTDSEVHANFKNELLAGFMNTFQDRMRVYLIAVDGNDEDKLSIEYIDRIKNILGNGFDFDKIELLPCKLPGADLEVYRNIHDCDGVILAIDAGKRNGAMAEHTISQLYKHDCPILGIVLTNADTKFLKWYYKIKG